MNLNEREEQCNDTARVWGVFAGFIIGIVIILLVVAVAGCSGPKLGGLFGSGPDAVDGWTPRPPSVETGADVTNYTFALIALGIAGCSVFLFVSGATGRAVSVLLAALAVAAAPFVLAEGIELIRGPLQYAVWGLFGVGVVFVCLRLYERYRAWKDAKGLARAGRAREAAAVVIAANPQRYASKDQRRKLVAKLEEQMEGTANVE